MRNSAVYWTEHKNDRRAFMSYYCSKLMKKDFIDKVASAQTL